MASTTVTIPPPPADTTYHGLSEAEIQAQANALADASIAASQASIQRQQAAAAAAAQRDAATLQGLGQAQMGMISQIPANIQAIRNTAAQAIASTAGQIAGAQLQQTQAERAANAAFTASQVGSTAQAAPSPGGVNPAGAAAAEEAIGGTFPAQEQVGMGAASAIAASGMPAVVARATQDQVAMRMSQAATQDADYRQQLIDLAATRGGVYQQALSGIYDIEAKKFGIWEAQQRLTLDQKNFALQQRAQAANEKLAQGKAAYDQWVKAQQLAQGQERINLASAKAKAALQAAIAQGARPNAALSKAYGIIVDSNGNPILDASGQQIPVAKGGKGGGGPSGGVAKANSMAKDFRGTPFTTVTDPLTGKTTPARNRPKTSYQSALNQITAALVDDGYSQADATRIATGAVNTAYGPGVGGRPGKLRGPGFVGK